MMSRLLCILLLGVIYVSTYTSEAKSMNKDLLRLVRLFEDIEFEDREDKKEDRSLAGKGAELDLSETPMADGRVLSEGDMMLTPVQVEEDKQAKRNLKMGKEDLGSSINNRIINAGRGRGLLKRGHSALQNPKGELDLSETPMADGTVLSEGDMMLTPVQVKEDKQAKRNLKMGLEKRKGIKRTDRRWTDNTLPYVITPNTFSNADMKVMKQAFSDFNEYTCLTVKPRTTEANYITIMDGATIDKDGCWSYIGMINEGSQNVSLSSGCQDKDTVIHELGHALGFQHEHCRYDRDEFVTIDLTTVPENEQDNYHKYSRNTMYVHKVAYDYGSVMHYDEISFGKGVTIIAKDPSYQKKMGHSKGLSFADVKTLNRMYSCGDHCTGSCPDDGYFDENCKCQCHSGADVFKSGTVPINICDGCGCEEHRVSFCNYDDGSTGTCESCSEHRTEVDCRNAGLPAAGVEDCIRQCFPGCARDEFTCSSGKCVYDAWVCDGEDDCGDSSDEQNCTGCARDEFTCSSGKCVYDAWVCDGEDDCGDSSDEQNCTGAKRGLKFLLKGVAKQLHENLS